MRQPQVFVSRATVVTPEQAAQHSRWSHHLATFGFQTIEIDRADYAASPWGQLRAVIRAADGVLVLGFRQLSIEKGLWRPGTAEMATATQWHPTSWNQLEAGMAVMAGVPVLVAPDPGITDGVFDANLWGGEVFGVAQVDLDDRSSMPGCLVRWAECIQERVSRDPSGPGAPP